MGVSLNLRNPAVPSGGATRLPGITHRPWPPTGRPQIRTRRPPTSCRTPSHVVGTFELAEQRSCKIRRLPRPSPGRHLQNTGGPVGRLADSVRMTRLGSEVSVCVSCWVSALDGVQGVGQTGVAGIEVGTHVGQGCDEVGGVGSAEGFVQGGLS